MTGNSVSIQLDSTIRNSLGPSARTYAQASRMEMKQKRRNHQPDDQGTVRFPFQFTIPSHILIPKGGGASAIEMVHPLPPSLCIDAGSVVPPSIERNNFRGDCKITYTLHAYLMCDGRPTTGTFRHVMLFPTQEPQPPSCTSDFPGDYILSRSAVLRTGMLFRRRGLLSVETREPAPLEMSRGKSGASTTVNLTLRFRESREIRSACGSMPPATPAFGVVSLKLKQTTFISVEPQRRLPATRDLLTSTVMVKDTNIINEQSRKMKFSPWLKNDRLGKRKSHLSVKSCVDDTVVHFLLVWIANTSIREISRANYQYLVWNTTASMMNDSSGMRDGRRSQSEINNTDCPSAQTLFNTIIRAARDALQETHLTYDNVHAFDASIVVELQRCYYKNYAYVNLRLSPGMALQGDRQMKATQFHNSCRTRQAGFDAWN
ncbi:conserved hypothetical protein [Histoplasma capsulatum H143]|uniref:Arrestin n=1 Tax=Ajellomyces capsulatus (strain H143) TaxID=544712 RepID=C6HBG7_AJECH|nr:conserved hypothetical protein [Histoplasma capsulatum H143]